METKASRSHWFEKGEREDNSNSNIAIILKYRVNLSIILDFGERAGRKTKGEKEVNPRLAEERWIKAEMEG